MRSLKYDPKRVIQRFSERNLSIVPSTGDPSATSIRQPSRIRQFFNIAMHRRRQILEKMLMDR